MKTSEFVQLLQNELILPRDPHLADRFAALLDENYEPVAPKQPTPADGVNIVLQGTNPVETESEASEIGPTTQNAVIVSNGPGDLGTGTGAIVQQSESEAK